MPSGKMNAVWLLALGHFLALTRRSKTTTGRCSIQLARLSPG
jgi:hypothetical protein